MAELPKFNFNFKASSSGGAAASNGTAPANQQPPKSPAVTDLAATIKAMAAVTAEEPEEMTGDEKANFLIETTNEVEVKLADATADPKASLYSVETFESLQLSPEILKGVYAMGYQRPSKIQGRALPILMAKPYKNFIGQSQSGTGKTAAFVLATLSRIELSKAATQAIIIAPTRELANQILGVMKQMAQFTQISCTQALKDSVERGQQLRDHVIVGTPGTVMDMLKRRSITGDSVQMLVIDEADIMLDMQGMGDQTLRIKKMLPNQCQTILFSATYKDEVKMFAERVVPHANMISLKREELSVDAIRQLYLDCQSEEKKFEVLCDIYGLCNIGQSIIFCQRRETADAIAKRMEQNGHQITVIHGGLESADRDRIFNSFRSGETKVLITTNVMARGIDVLDVNLVINYDIPVDRHHHADFENYLHRIGRTGRFGRRGISINFVHDQKSLALTKEIEQYFGRPIKRIDTSDIVTLEKELKDALKNR